MAAIAIDGPAGAGKSTIAKRIAQELNYIYVDTGALYRAMAYYFVTNRIDIEDEAALGAACKSITIDIQYENNIQQVYLNGENVTAYLRTEETGNMASKSSAKPPVRAALLDLQRDMAKAYPVVMDGRDIGTNVLPGAEVKIYLTASSAERANRRYKELLEKGETPDFARIEADIIERDERDMNRAIAPLKQAEDAVLVDSSDMGIDEVVAEILSVVKQKLQ
ncbi:MAG: (d)CMP kinase [Bacteroidales bacterium]|nr:(d)CMP kinase [Clostridium sp.]MCM1203096.1 (d)CMP kinase [Bacteroidales bacterium]